MRFYKTDARQEVLTEACRQDGVSFKDERQTILHYLYSSSLIRMGGRGYIATDRGRAVLATWQGLPSNPANYYRHRDLGGGRGFRGMFPRNA
jgi:hypothetical protein